MGNHQNKSKIQDYILLGLTNQAIATKLNISKSTVKWHATSLFKQYGVKSRAELMSLKSCDTPRIKLMQSEINRLTQELLQCKLELESIRKYTLPLGVKK
jgi:orotate phosphoribosyltransferase-like protein